MFKKYKTMHEWYQNNPIDDKPHRELIKLAVIDDEGFIKDELSRLNFDNIRIFEKFTDLKDFANYNVILCDIKGIGQNIDSNLDGIAVARDLKKNYPEKIVLQYSGQSVNDYDPKFYQNMVIDGFVEKSQSSKQLADELDKYCSIFWNPYSAWKYIEKTLRDLNIENINIAKFENLYVESLSKKKNYIEMEKNRKSIVEILSVGIGLVSLACEVINLFIK